MRRSSRGCWWSSSSTPLAGAYSARSSRRGAEGEVQKSEVRSPEVHLRARGGDKRRASSWCWCRRRRAGRRKRRPSRLPTSPNLKTIADVPHEYHLVDYAGRAGEAHPDLAEAGLVLLRHRNHQPRSQRSAPGRAGVFLRAAYRLLRPGAAGRLRLRTPHSAPALPSWRSSAPCWSPSASKRSGTTSSST